MIWNAASLTLLLAYAGTKTAAAQAGDVKSVLKKSMIKEMHEKTVAALTKKASEAPRVAVVKDDSNRALFENNNFLNYFYSSDDSCANAPYSNSGLGMGSCIPDINYGAYKLACSGDQTEIVVSFIVFDTDDCSDSAAFSGTLDPQDYTCATVPDDDDYLDDYLVEIDDRFALFGNPPQSSFSVTCDTQRSAENTFADISYFNDDTCNLMTGYYGINYETCVPFFNNDYLKVTAGGCSFAYFGDDTCSHQISNDDYNFDDVFIDDDYDTYNAGCVPTSALSDDDYYSPSGEYMSFSLATCFADDDFYWNLDDSNSCFAMSETVLLESGATKAISDVEVGDAIQVVSADGSLAFSEVVFLPHGANTQRALFAELELASGNSLRATPAHFVLAGACGADAFELTAMKNVAEGSCVQTAGGEDEVTGNGHVVDHGMYTVVTKESSGLVVVNGVRASSFAHNHWLLNNYYNIHRAVYEVAPSLMKNRDVVAANLIIGDIALSL
jgi:hypothetical protein